MNIEWIQEPKLEFHAGQHEDIRFGLMNYGPFDIDKANAPGSIRLGIVGTKKNIDGSKTWLEHCCSGIDAKETTLNKLFPRFPGFGKDTCFNSEILFEDRCLRSISSRDVSRALETKDETTAIHNSISLFLEHIRFLAEETNVNVIICAIPSEIVDIPYVFEELAKNRDDEEREQPDYQSVDFHHMLKAATMQFRKPIQLIKPATYGSKYSKKRKTKTGRLQSLQDEATRAWNFFTALYYKAGGKPWRLPRIASQLTTCYVGIRFYKTLDQEEVHTSVAQIFNELGEGIVIRGTQAEITKDDRQPHLSSQDASVVLQNALDRYRQEHKTHPARVVLHKSSKFTEGEKEGFLNTLAYNKIEIFDMISIRKSNTRLYRTGSYPTLRGTLLSLDDINHILYTRGSVYFYETYPGLYIPRPILFRSELSDNSAITIGREILSLTKMNWNSSQFDHSMPITIEAAHRVGNILKYVKQDCDICPHYSYYM